MSPFTLKCGPDRNSCLIIPNYIFVVGISPVISPLPQLKTTSSLSTWSILDLRGGSYFFFLWKLRLNSLPTNSFPPWQVAESWLKTVHLTLKASLSSLWEITWVSFDPLFCSVKTFWILIKLFRVFIHSLNFTLFTHFLFIQQVFNELPWDTRSRSKSQGWSRGPADKFLLLGNWCSLKVPLGLNLSKLGLPE